LQHPRRHHAGVAGNDYAVRSGQDRIHESELGDRRGDLGDLRLGMQAGVPGKWNEPLQGPMVDLLDQHRGTRARGSFAL
jgi:hypothetical protein